MTTTTISLEEVASALREAVDGDPVVVKKGEAKLAAWETNSGFFYLLIEIFHNANVDVNLRWISAVYFKNGCIKYWRKNVKNEMSNEEKEQIRIKLLSNINEPVPQIASQVATSIGKLVRIDFPKEWPQLIPFLVENVRSEDEQLQYRALTILLQVVKAVASKRMLSDRRAYYELTTQIYGFIYQLHESTTNNFFQLLQNNPSDPNTLKALDKAVIVLRIIRKLTIFGSPKPHTSNQCMMFLQNTFNLLKQSLQIRYEMQRMSVSSDLSQLFEKFILKQVKILNEFLEHHPVSFVPFISAALDFSFAFTFHDGINLIVSDNKLNFENFVIQSINLMRGILHSNIYNTYVQENVPDEIDINLALTVKKEFFTNERLSFISEKILSNYLILTQEEIEQWADDPESFYATEAGETWKYCLKPCVENFYLTLFNHYRTEMTEDIIKYIAKSQSITLSPDSNVQDILAKDAIYNAAGLTAFNLFDELDFDNWFASQLVQEIKIPGENFRILRRRIIWLVGQWTGVKFSKNLRPTLYEICLWLLTSNEDMYIKLSTAKTLSQTIEDFEFQPDQFREYLAPTFNALFEILKKSRDCDTKMSILSTTSSIVDKMGSYANPHAEHFIAYLPLLWKESEQHNMLRCCIISTLQNVVKIVSEIQSVLTQFLYSVINYSTNITIPAHIYLIEEGLELWLAVVDNSSACNEFLLDLAGNLLPIIEQSSENMRNVLFIIKSYIFLDANAYLSRFGNELVNCCITLLNDLRPDGIVLIMKVFETIIRSDVGSGVNILRPVLPHIFKQVFEGNGYPMVFGSYITILARVFLYDQNLFVQFLPGGVTDFPNNFEKLMEIWLNRMPLITQPEKKKLLSLALGATLSSIPNPIIESRLNAILQNIGYSIQEIIREENDSDTYDEDIGVSRAKTAKVLIDTLVYGEDMYEWEALEYTSLQLERRRKIDLKDPVHNVILTTYIDSQLDAVKSKIGVENFNSLISNSLDASVIMNLKEYLNVFNDISVPDFSILNE